MSLVSLIAFFSVGFPVDELCSLAKDESDLKCGLYCPWTEGTCASTVRQSPINIVPSTDDLVESFSITYPAEVPVTKKADKWMVQDGFMDAYVMQGEKRFNLLQFHLHAPSEHTISGVTYPAEVHFVHGRGSGADLELLVIGVLFSDTESQGKPTTSAWLGSLTSADEIDVETMLPMVGTPLVDNMIASKFYNYPGSLTAGGCNEIVEWVVSEHIEPSSSFQICGLNKKSRTLSVGANADDSKIFESARKPQPLSGRTIRMGEWS